MIEGTVIHGEKIGRSLGYPTANLDVSIENLSLSDGVYAAKATIGHDTYNAALIVIRVRKKCEVHLLDFSGDLYGRHLHVEPVQRVSAIERFDSMKELKEKMDKDMMLVRSCLGI